MRFRYRPCAKAFVLIFNIAGDLITALDPKTIPAREGEAWWDGSLPSNWPTAAGVYVALIRTPCGAYRIPFALVP